MPGIRQLPVCGFFSGTPASFMIQLTKLAHHACCSPWLNLTPGGWASNSLRASSRTVRCRSERLSGNAGKFTSPCTAVELVRCTTDRPKPLLHKARATAMTLRVMMTSNPVRAARVGRCDEVDEAGSVMVLLYHEPSGAHGRRTPICYNILKWSVGRNNSNYLVTRVDDVRVTG